MFYVSVSDAINVRLHLQTCPRKKTMSNRLAFKKLIFSSYAQVPVSFIISWGFCLRFFTVVVVLAVLLYQIKMQRLLKNII